MTPVTRRNFTIARSQREVIEDSGGDLPRSTGITARAGNNKTNERIDSTPPDIPDETSALETEFDEGYERLQDSNKRRRVEEDPRAEIGEESIQSPDQNYSRDVPEFPSTPAPRMRPSAAAANPNPQATPAMLPRPTSLATYTPANTVTPFRNKPRFILSTQKPPSTQPTFRAETPAATQPTSTPFERKPAFVLPRSPSPKEQAEDIPAPFSPSSRTLRRRGRKRGDGAAYAPGGMAAEVRSWILETGSKREQAKRSESLFHDARGTNGSGQYLITARVLTASQMTLSSSGPLAFIRAEPVDGDIKDCDENIHILAMGDPRRKPVTLSSLSPFQINAGDLLGFHRGLAWDIDLHAAGARAHVSPEDQHASSEVDGSQDPKQRWLVAMEWDILEESVVSEE